MGINNHADHELGSRKRFFEYIFKFSSLLAGIYTCIIGLRNRIIWLRDKNLNDKQNMIEADFEFRKKIKKKLEKYVYEKHNNKIRDIGIRFVFCKNYPRQLHDDGYEKLLHVSCENPMTLPYGFINKTGVNFQEHPWLNGESFYVDNDGIYCISTAGNKIKGFQEYANCILVLHMPYYNIVNFDFQEYIEYEPIFYIKYPYCHFKKLYDDNIFICNLPEHDYLHLELCQSRFLKKYSWLRYQIKRLEVKIRLF